MYLEASGPRITLLNDRERSWERRYLWVYQMNRVTVLACAPALTVATFCVYFATGAMPNHDSGQTKAVVTATMAFLNSLRAAQREKASVAEICLYL
jgi:hypothetical protein